MNTVLTKELSEIKLENVKLGGINDNSSNVTVIYSSETLKNKDIPLLLNKRYVLVETHSQLMFLLKNGVFRVSMLSLSNPNLEEKKKLLRMLDILNSGKFPLKVKVTGHLKGSYSLAIVTRDFALSLDKYTNIDVSVSWNEYNKDFDYNLRLLSEYNPRLIQLIEKASFDMSPDIEIRNVWPIYSVPSDAKLLMDYVPWEESLLPQKFVAEYSKFDALFSISEFVATALKASGLEKKYVKNIGLGVDKVNIGEINKISRKNESIIRFLNISSGLPRKGLKDLIDAFVLTFNNDTNVELLLKTYPNPNNDTEDYLKEKYPNQKNINIINSDLSSEKIEELYSKADVYVSTSKGEGFNRPVAEAMLRNIPVITTGWSGHMDFCNESNSLLIDYELENSSSHLSGDNSKWAKIKIDDLIEKLKQVQDEILSNSSILLKRINNANKDCNRINDWEKVSKLTEEELTSLSTKYYKIGVLTTWHTKCGIATHSESLIEAYPNENVKFLILANESKLINGVDTDNVVRCWDEKMIVNSQHTNTYKVAILNNIDHLLIQYHPGQHSLFSILKLISDLGKRNIKTTFEIHAIRDFIELLSRKHELHVLFNENKNNITNIICHSDIDKVLLKDYFESNKIEIVRVGQYSYKKIEERELNEIKSKIGINDKFVVSSHGYMIPHKGFDIILEAVEILKNKGFNNIVFLNISSLKETETLSIDALNKINEIIKKYNVKDEYIHLKSFLSQDQIFKLLSLSNLVVFPYRSNNESASGAVRNALLTGLPILVSKEKVFDDIRPYVTTLENIDSNYLATEIEKYISSKNTFISTETRAELELNSWKNVSQQLINVIIENVRK